MLHAQEPWSNLAAIVARTKVLLYKVFSSFCLYWIGLLGFELTYMSSQHCRIGLCVREKGYADIVLGLDIHYMKGFQGKGSYKYISGQPAPRQQLTKQLAKIFPSTRPNLTLGGAWTL